MIITPTSLTVSQLFGSTNEQYVIPAYQRRYSWQEKQIWEFIDDISLIEGNDTHLLGSIVCLSGHHKAGLNRLELVDGQQRLTTITILLECVRQRFENDNDVDAAKELGRLLSAKPLGGESLRKVALDSIDSDEFHRLIRRENGNGFKNQSLVRAFGIFREWLDEQSLEEIGGFIYRLQNQAIVIRLDVSEAKDAFKLFETINNRGLKLSSTDIIKNFLLGNAARFGREQLEIARASWAKLIEHLDGTNPDVFFRYFLMARTEGRVTASTVVSSFKTLFMVEVLEATNLPDRHYYVDVEPLEDEQEDFSELEIDAADMEEVDQISFADFINRLVNGAKIYGELVLVKTKKPGIDRHLRNLRMIKSIQTYGFLMHLRMGGCSDKHFIDVLKLTESFILRRHICRERTNDNETLFSKLCGIIDPKDPVRETREAYRELCPSDEKFGDEFAKASFPASVIDRARYCLEKIELSFHGGREELQVLGGDAVHVEHIIPQKIKTKKAKDEYGDWESYLGAQSDRLHKDYVSRIGNLTIFSGILNISASNNPFARKKRAYKESAIIITRELAEMPHFKFKNVERRSKDLAGLAVDLWPKP